MNLIDWLIEPWIIVTAWPFSNCDSTRESLWLLGPWIIVTVWPLSHCDSLTLESMWLLDHWVIVTAWPLNQWLLDSSVIVTAWPYNHSDCLPLGHCDSLTLESLWLFDPWIKSNSLTFESSITPVLLPCSHLATGHHAEQCFQHKGCDIPPNKMTRPRTFSTKESEISRLLSEGALFRDSLGDAAKPRAFLLKI
jgi:hypothetical protein